MSKNLDRIKSVAVYCGSRTPMKHAFEEAAAELAKFIAAHGMTLIFGGSNVGTMKTVADAALAAGGKVVGVFTTNLPMPLAHPGLTELVVTHSLAERKREMIERADALVALPGGLGTLDELFDALALRRVKNGGHKKPVGVLNVNGYYDPLLDFIIQTRNAGFSSGSAAQTLVSGRTPDELFDRLVGDRVLLLFPLPFLAGQSAHIIIEAAGRAEIMLDHCEILETASQEHSGMVHCKMVRKFGTPWKVSCDFCARGDGRYERLFPEVAAEKMVRRTVLIAERSSALPVMQAIPEHVADRSQDVVVAVQRQQKEPGVKKGARAQVPVPVILGDPHLQPAAALDHPLLFGESDPVQMGGHHGIGPQFHLAGETLERKDVGYVPDVLVVTKKHFVVTRNAEMIKSFHSS